jgi:hypothetical protein
MSIGASIFLIAVGAILKYAVTVQNTDGFDLNTMGVILMIVGALGLLVSLIWARTATLGPWSRRETVVRERDIL